MPNASTKTDRQGGTIRFHDGCWWLISPDHCTRCNLAPHFQIAQWNVGQLSKNLGIGTRTFARMVEEGVGLGPKRWLREIRINGACHLLRQNIKIQIIATDLGFSSLPEFSKEFKKLLGVSPAHYVRSERSRSEFTLP